MTELFFVFRENKSEQSFPKWNRTHNQLRLQSDSLCLEAYLYNIHFQLREEWERGQEAALDSAVCPHDVATLLKEFLRDLPDPLLCRDLYPAFLNTQSK